MMRSIAMSTTVTLLVPEDRRDRANGHGRHYVTGVSFAVMSVFSGLVIGHVGMGWALYGSVALTVVALLHLQTIHFEEPEPERTDGVAVPKVDVRGALDAIHAVPGLGMLIALAAFNNLLGGVFMALMDAYGLELVSVETWGLLWGFISLAFIVGGVVVARRGLGPRPLRVIILANLVNWTVCAHVRAAVVDRAADDRDVHVARPHPRDRGRADRAPAVDPVRATRAASSALLSSWRTPPLPSPRS